MQVEGSGTVQTKTKQKRAYVAQKDVPRHTLAEAVRVARVLADHYAGSSAEPIDVAASLGVQPSTGTFRTLTGAALAFEITDGGAYAGEISLTDLGRRIVMPTEEGDDRAAMREALVRPRVFREFLTRYDGKKLPPPEIARNVLLKLGVPTDATERAANIIMESARETGVLQEINGETYVRLRGASQAAEDSGEPTDTVGEDAVVVLEEPGGMPAPTISGQALLDDQAPASVKPIFVGHGKKTGPLDKLIKMLKELNIPHKAAVGEPNLGRPIPKKVKDVMAECGSAILLFTKDEKFLDPDGNEVWRPSENVVYELGAASFAYDDRIVIFMEDGLHFPANFESVGRIDFDQGGIEAKSMDLLKELVGFGLVKITPAA